MAGGAARDTVPFVGLLGGVLVVPVRPPVASGPGPSRPPHARDARGVGHAYIFLPLVDTFAYLTNWPGYGRTTYRRTRGTTSVARTLTPGRGSSTYSGWAASSSRRYGPCGGVRRRSSYGYGNREGGCSTVRRSCATSSSNAARNG